jgi:hypothetical protein
MIPDLAVGMGEESVAAQIYEEWFEVDRQCGVVRNEVPYGSLGQTDRSV